LNGSRAFAVNKGGVAVINRNAAAFDFVKETDK